MTAEELLQQQKNNAIEVERQKKAKQEALLAAQKAQLEADKTKAAGTLDETKLKEQGNIGYQGAKTQMQGSILDNYSGFGTDTGAGIQRQDTRTMATSSRLSNLDSEYAKAKGNLESDFALKSNENAFQTGQLQTDFENTVANLENDYKLAIENQKFQEAESIRKQIEADKVAAQKETQKYENDIASNVESFILENAKTDGVYDANKANQILANAQAWYGFSDATMEKLKARIGVFDFGGSSVSAPVTKVTNTSNVAREQKAQQFTSQLEKLANDREKNSYGFLTRISVDSAIKQRRDREDYKMDNYANFASGSVSMMNEIINKVSNGEITQTAGQLLIDKYRLGRDIDKMIDLGFIEDTQGAELYNALKGVGLDG